jgi:hypothetical protein
VFPGIVHWSIFKCSLSDEETRAKKRGAEERRSRAWNLPTGVDVNEMKALWDQIDYGGQRRNGEGEMSSPMASPFKPASFRPPSSNIKMLRQLSKGRKGHAADLAVKGTGKPRIIVGEPNVDSSQSLVTTVNDVISDTDLYPPSTPLSEQVLENQEVSPIPPSLEPLSGLETTTPTVSDFSSQQSQPDSVPNAVTEDVSVMDSKDSTNESDSAAGDHVDHNRTTSDLIIELGSSSLANESTDAISGLSDFPLVTDADGSVAITNNSSTTLSKSSEMSTFTMDHDPTGVDSDPSECRHSVEVVDAEKYTHDSSTEPPLAESSALQTELGSIVTSLEPSGLQSSHSTGSPDLEGTPESHVQSVLHNDTKEV